MPRKVDPGTIKTGAGKAVPPPTTLRLGGALPPDIGVGVQIPEGQLPEGGVLGLAAHLQDPVGAHPATAISSAATPPLESDNLGGQTLEIVGGLPVKPPELGVPSWLPNFLAAPMDWGTLKMGDGPVTNDVLVLNPNHPSAGNSPADVLPYHFIAANPTPDWETRREYGFQDSDPASIPHVDDGREPERDIWNLSAVVGGGPGVARAGAFTDLNGQPIFRTTRLLPRAEDSVGAVEQFKVCISGIVFPADRGVLALVQWPHDGDVADFLAQGLTERCVAALLLGTGLREGGGSCYTVGGSAASGGIFDPGTDADGNYDPFAYPGRATGQYNLDELYTGISSVDGSALKAPWNVGSQRAVNSIFPALGQVRLGTDPEAGLPNESPYGIPILGAGPDAYTDPLSFANVDGYDAVGSSFVLSTNFFAYRLPILDNYDARSGMKYTPRGLNPFDTRETSRYLMPFAPYDNTDTTKFETVGGIEYLKEGGNYHREMDPDKYTNLPSDCWTWQVARFRHSFYVPDSDTGDMLGSYWLLHFKTEADFEAFVRDGVMPWDATDGYDLYGAFPAATIEGDENVVNRVALPTQSPAGPAPDYGYAASAFWMGRLSLFIGDETKHTDCLPTTNTFSWNVPGVSPGIMWCSGVAYMTPRTLVGADSFAIDDVEVVVPAATFPWDEGYRIDDNPLTDDVLPLHPAVINSPSPAFLGMGDFAYGEDSLGDPTYTINDAGFTDARGRRIARVEFPFTHLGTHGGNPFSEVNGPETGDDLRIKLNGTITFAGDPGVASFTTAAAPRVFIRRPLGPVYGWEYAALPWAGGPTGGHGAVLAEPGGDSLLFHSTAFDTTNLIGEYGNFTDPLSAPANQGYAPLFTADKDTRERFLDEMYRYLNGWSGAATLAQRNQLNGPGMRGWIGGPIAVPVQAGYTTTGAWLNASWTRNLAHTASLGGIATELQVVGLPPRNPPLSDWITKPPSSGLLQYPQIDYTVGYRPDGAEGVAQPDYSALAGDRVYIRAFDVAFSRSTAPAPTAVGQPLVTLRLDGILLRDFAYSPPGPGFFAAGLAVMVKIPGLTTWMDLGRADGSGPGKQDPVLDGAGCLVAGPYTFDSVDAETGLVYCQIRANLGPAATLALGDGNEVPVLVKVVMRDVANVKNYDLQHEANLPTAGYGWTGNVGQAVQCARVRGITGIQVIHPDEIEVDPGVSPVPPA